MERKELWCLQKRQVVDSADHPGEARTKGALKYLGDIVGTPVEFSFNENGYTCRFFVARTRSSGCARFPRTVETIGRGVVIG